MPRRRQLVTIAIQLPLSLALFAAAAHAADRPVRHPFRGVELVDGRIPLLDVKDSPAGRRYAVVDQGGQLAEDAPLLRSSGIVELAKRPLAAATRAELVRQKGTDRGSVAATTLSPRSPISPRLAAAIAGSRFGAQTNAFGVRPAGDSRSRFTCKDPSRRPFNETYQTAQFWDFDWQDEGVSYHFDGDNGQSTDVTFAILERGGFRTTHKSYREGAGAETRVRGQFQCSDALCLSKIWASNEQTFHATAAAGSVFGDYTDGQDAATANATDRIRRSAPGREGKGYLYKVNSTTTSSRLAFEHLVERSPRPSIVSYSIPFSNGDTQCKGEDSLSRDVDELLYENDLIDDPGVLIAWMLLSGDRTRDGGKMTANFDKRWGAGRLRLRMLNGPGMDAPWYFASGWTCVDDNEEVFLSIAGGEVLSSDIDVAKAVIWWYDHRLENGTKIDDVDLAWVRSDGTALVNSVSANDNRERVHLSGAGNKALSLKLTGFDVTADGAGCGSNSMKVFFAALLEDSDRDDDNGPEWNAASCQGVEPM